ncbi:MAG: hypothetical protein HY673_12680 [Chloroflexi bacterium]|nr:hypothetical protein [Chloroflexota bacterium]
MPWERAPSTPVPMTSGANTPDIDFALGPGGAISGRVRNANGSVNLADIPVFALPVDGSDWARWGLSRLDCQYTINRLPYGSYKVYAGGDRRHAPEHYNDKASGQDADPVTVDSGVNPTGIDFYLDLAGATPTPSPSPSPTALPSPYPSPSPPPTPTPSPTPLPSPSPTPAPPLTSTPLRGDRNRDGVVDTADLSLVVASFNKRDSDPGFDPNADANGDGIIDVLDLVIVGLDFGGTR